MFLCTSFLKSLIQGLVQCLVYHILEGAVLAHGVPPKSLYIVDLCDRYTENMFYRDFYMETFRQLVYMIGILLV
jgi:hypothetical protein